MLDNVFQKQVKAVKANGTKKAAQESSSDESSEEEEIKAKLPTKKSKKPGMSCILTQPLH